MAFPSRGRFKARGRTKRPEPGTMNGIEREYADMLDRRKRLGEVIAWVFEGLRVKLADNTHYTPDFYVLLADGSIELHEVKACNSDGSPRYEDDARVKIKVAAREWWWYRFRGAYRLPKKLGGAWKFEVFD